MKDLLMNKKSDYRICIFVTIVLMFAIFIKDKHILDIFITTLYISIIASAWNIMCGYTGLISLGHAVFVGLGQYTPTILFLKFSVSPWIGMFAGAIIAIFFAFLIGVLTLRLKHYFFSLATIALGTIMHVLAVKFDNLTGGSVGLSIPFRPSLENMMFKEYQSYYLLFIFLLFAVLMVTAYINKSRLGINLVAIREDEVAASSLGINLLKNKVIALCISAFFTSIAGTLYVQYSLFVDPEGAFSLELSIKAALLSLIGGAGTIFGPLLGGAILGPTETFLRGWLGSTFSGAYLIIYGILIIFVVLVMPNGILGAITNIVYNKTKK